MLGWGFAVALTTLAGHSIGEKNYEKTKKYVYYTITLSIITMGVTALIFFFFPKELISLFIKESEKKVIELGAMCLVLAAIEQIPNGYSNGFRRGNEGNGRY